MTIFSSLEKAVSQGFYWLEFRPDLGVHIVERVFTRQDGKLVKAMALARAVATEPQGCTSAQS